MAITTLAENLSFLGIDNQYFDITGGNDELVFTSSRAGPRTITVTHGSYDCEELADQLESDMNDDSTLTGSGAITFSVSYSSTTYKFTIDAGAGETIAYTHSGSSAGFEFGFDDDHSAAQTITSDNPVGDPTTIISTIKDDVEDFVSNYCNRTFESTSYSLEEYNGRGYNKILLKNYPVTTLDRVSIGTRDAIKISNSNTGTSATVSVLSTGLRLVLDGSADVTVTFATYTTISTVVSAVNALGNGWSASVLSSSLSSFKSTELLPRQAANCLSSTWIYLQIPDIAEYDIQTDLNAGILVLSYPVTSGFKNIFIDYTAGYSSSTMPDDLKLAIFILVQYVYEKAKKSMFGLETYNIGTGGTTGLRMIYEKEKKDFPREAINILGRYRRYKV